ncbi:MAG: hypothetical protein MUF15_03955 [Acidobacteria bacterium]|nr:hypothetical protein [Acidobacteriota bacterium]
MTDVKVTNNCVLAEFLVEDENNDSIPVKNGDSRDITVKNNLLPIRLAGGKPDDIYTYTIQFNFKGNPFTIPLPTLPPDVSMSMGDPINVTIGDGQGGF